MKKAIALLFLGAIVLSGQAQNARKYYKNAKKLIESLKYVDALKELNQSIELDAKYIDAYVLRAQLSEKLENFGGAASDYEKAALLQPKTSDYFFQAGRLYYQIGIYNNALQMLNAAISLNSNNYPALLIKANTHIKLNQNRQALFVISNALQLQQTSNGYFTRGVANDSLKYYSQSIADYNAAIALEPTHQDAYYALTKAYLNNNQLDSALVIANKTVQKFSEAQEAYKTRSNVFYKRGEILNAINDLSKLETLTESKAEVLFTRGYYYFQYQHFQNAKSDFSQVLVLDPGHYFATYWLARSNEELMEDAEAIKDFNLFLEQTQNNQCCAKEVDDAKKRLYELKRESTAPKIKFDSLVNFNQDNRVLYTDSDTFTIKGNIIDESAIDSLLINGQQIELGNNNEFFLPINTSQQPVLSIIAKDVYGNTTTLDYTIKKTDKMQPEVHFVTPSSNSNNEICIPGKASNQVFEGEVVDASLIKEINVDGVNANFDNSLINPRFNIAVVVSNKLAISVKVVDEFNNILEKKFVLKRGCKN